MGILRVMTLGPHAFETKWNSFENRIVESLSKKKWILPLITLLYFTGAFFLYDIWTQAHFPSWARFNIIQDRLWAAYILLSFSFAPLFIKTLRHQPLFLFFVVAVSWLFPISKIGDITLTAFLPLLFLLVGSWLVKINKASVWLKTVILFFLYCALVSILTKEVLINPSSGKILLYFSNIHMDLLLLFFIGVTFNTRPFPLSIHYNPLQMFSPLPLPDSTTLAIEDSRYTQQFIRGIIELILSQALFVIVIMAYRSEMVATTTNPFIHYLLFLFVIVGAMKMVTSVLWIYGINSPSATYFFILAKSPIEIWQRGSVFIADFLFNKLYMPIWKKFRNLWLSSAVVIFAVLFHLFIFHELLIKSWLRWQFGDLLFGRFGTAEIKLWGFWLLTWIAFILIFSGFQKLTSRWHRQELFQWLLILITHIGCASIFPIVYYLVGIS